MSDSPAIARWVPVRDVVIGQSGPAIARWYQRWLAAVMVVAWLSLLVQVHDLIGETGLLPINDFLGRMVGEPDFSILRFPSIFYWGATDLGMTVAALFGIGLALAALAGRWPRVCLALSVPMYLSFAAAAAEFLAFQWDNLLIECCLLAALLPRFARAPSVHFLNRVLLFKLYFQSGIAKWQSYLGDWHDGSAMTFYYETAPLPTWVGWYAHHLPEWFHNLESWLALGLELVFPLLIFGGRRARLVALAGFSGFQVINLATANYGFFVYLALGLHLFLLEDRDLERAALWLRRRLRRGRAQLLDWLDSTVGKLEPPTFNRWVTGARVAFAMVFVGVSMLEAGVRFGPLPNDFLRGLRHGYAPYRLINTYHLFGHITRERIEPEVQIYTGGQWRAFHLRHKPGDPTEAPGFVAPHQPRLDFRLWFHGLSYRRGTPLYVRRLVDGVCHRRESVEGFFAEPLPREAVAVRMAYWRYTFTSWEERSHNGAWWNRESLATGRPVRCDQGE